MTVKMRVFRSSACTPVSHKPCREPETCTFASVPRALGLTSVITRYRPLRVMTDHFREHRGETVGSSGLAGSVGALFRRGCLVEYLHCNSFSLTSEQK